MALFLAVDAGGTKTDYLLADESRELARARGGTIKRMRADEATATAHLDEALTELAEGAGVSMQTIARTCIGTAGHTVPLVTEWLRAALACRVSGDLLLLGDVEIALDAAFQGGVGILVLAGTGSNVAARDRSGSLLGAGGWGPLMADQGSANRVGLGALRAAFLAKDEGRQTRLLGEAMRFWNLGSEERLIEYANATPAPDFSRFAERVHRCALEGDAIASAVLKKEGEDLGYLVRLLARRLRADPESHSGRGDSLPAIAFAGSMMEHALLLRTALFESVRREFPGIEMLDGVVDPLAGALWRSRGGTAQPG